MKDGSKPLVEVEVRQTYGVSQAYPANIAADLLAKVANQKVLNLRVRELARDLGFEVVEKYGRSLQGVA